MVDLVCHGIHSNAIGTGTKSHRDGVGPIHRTVDHRHVRWGAGDVFKVLVWDVDLVRHRVHRKGTGSVSSSYGGDRILCMGRQPSDCRDNVEGNCGSLFPIKGRHYEYPRETQFKLESIELTTFENDCPVYERVHPLKGLSGE